jgi:hypothetical protein
MEFFRRRALRPRPSAKPKDRIELKKPLSVRYAELLRLRQAILEAQTAKPSQKDQSELE